MFIFAIILLNASFSIIGCNNNFENSQPNYATYTSTCCTHAENKDVKELVKMTRELCLQKSFSVKELADELSPLINRHGFAIAQALSIIVCEEIGTSNNLHLVRTCFASLKAMNLLIHPDYFTMINKKLESLKFLNQHADFIAAVENNLMAFLQSMTVEQSIGWKVISNDEYLLKKATSFNSYSQDENVLSAYEKTILEIHCRQKSYFSGDDIMDNIIAHYSTTKSSIGRSIGRNININTRQ